jgi:hypothetical protein
MSKRRRYKQSISLKGRLANFAEEDFRKAPNLPPGSDRDEMLKKVQADIASRVDEWATRADRSRRLGAMTINENARQPNDG